MTPQPGPGSFPEPPELPEDALPALLAGTAPTGLYRWHPTHPAEQALPLATAHGWHTASLDLTGAAGKGDLLTRTAEALHFPAYFGHNWDALADCLGDLSWLGPARGTLLLVREWAAFADRAPLAAATAAEIFAEAAAPNFAEAAAHNTAADDRQGRPPLVVLLAAEDRGQYPGHQFRRPPTSEIH
ncbi:barstar family protein [Streptomyces boninensis]|uniref:barstar family protein n=1 Tax=Streptomyces boninensis TaxID=2039455 RepID=UPI003B223301